jgi:hypothetical protein
VEDPTDSECPVSSITPKSLDLVNIVALLETTNRATGSAAAALELPGSVLDAIRVCESESNVISSAMEDTL